MTAAVLLSPKFQSEPVTEPDGIPEVFVNRTESFKQSKEYEKLDTGTWLTVMESETVAVQPIAEVTVRFTTDVPVAV